MSFCAQDITQKTDANGETREFVDVKLENGPPISSLCDTGANRNGISMEELTKYGLSDLIDSSLAGKAKLANGALFQTIGMIDIKIDVEGTDYNVPFCVVDKLAPSIILGTPFLKQCQVMSDFKEAIQNRLRKNE